MRLPGTIRGAGALLACGLAARSAFAQTTASTSASIATAASKLELEATAINAHTFRLRVSPADAPRKAQPVHLRGARKGTAEIRAHRRMDRGAA